MPQLSLAGAVWHLAAGDPEACIRACDAILGEDAVAHEFGIAVRLRY